MTKRSTSNALVDVVGLFIPNIICLMVGHIGVMLTLSACRYLFWSFFLLILIFFCLWWVCGGENRALFDPMNEGEGLKTDFRDL